MNLSIIFLSDFIGCPEKDVTVSASVGHSAINTVEGL